MVGWHHRLTGHEFEQALGAGEGQGSVACCSPRGHKKSDMTWRLHNNNRYVVVSCCCCCFICLFISCPGSSLLCAGFPYLQRVEAML